MKLVTVWWGTMSVLQAMKNQTLIIA